MTDDKEAMTQTSQVEIERKYDVDDGALTPTFTAVDGIAGLIVEETVHLEAVYYDTDALDLLRRRIIIRRREGGGDEGWHIKLPAKEGRTELHWPLELDVSVPVDAACPVPDAVLERVRVVVRDFPLTPVARISTRRSASHLLNDDGVAVAEFADDQVTASDVRGGVERSWREWEVELLPGAPATETLRTALLDGIEVAVLAEDATVSTSPAKIARALGVGALPTAAGSAAESSKNQLTPKSPAAAVIVQVVRDLVASLEQLDPAARADEPDSVHRMRAVVRRIRSVFSVYGFLFDETKVASLNRQLRGLGGVLGKARDAEVLAQRAADELTELGHRADTGARRRLVEHSLEDYRRAHEAALRLLSSTPYYRLLDALDGFVTDPPLSSLGESEKSIKVVAALRIAAELKRLRKRADAAAVAVASGGSIADTPREEKLHETRKAARRLRFAAEAVSAGDHAVLGTKYREIAEEAKRVQDALGDHHDSALFAEHLVRTSNEAHAAGENTFVYGELSSRAKQRSIAALVAPPRALKRLDDWAASL